MVVRVMKLRISRAEGRTVARSGRATATAAGTSVCTCLSVSLVAICRTTYTHHIAYNNSTEYESLRRLVVALKWCWDYGRYNHAGKDARPCASGHVVHSARARDASWGLLGAEAFSLLRELSSSAAALNSQPLVLIVLDNIADNVPRYIHKNASTPRTPLGSA